MYAQCSFGLTLIKSNSKLKKQLAMNYFKDFKNSKYPETIYFLASWHRPGSHIIAPNFYMYLLK